MFKFLIGLFTVVTSFFGLWGSTSPVVASTSLNQGVKPSVIDYSELSTNLNVLGSLSQLDSQDSKNIFDHLGCSCLDCVSVQTDNQL